MKKYTQLPIPHDSAWSRFTIWRYLPTWLKEFKTGLHNLIKWAPTIYKQRDWDKDYIYIMLKKKLEFQRGYLVKANRHLGIPEVNRYITLCLNLIERIQEDYYSLEYSDYHKSKYEFIPCEDKPGYSTLNTEIISEDFDKYFAKYSNSLKRVLKKDPDLIEDRKYLAMRLGDYNQEKCQTLLFKVLNEKINNFWD